MSDAAPFWKADPRVWPLIVEQMAGREWAASIVDQDLAWMLDQITRGYLDEIPSRRRLMARWTWTERRVRDRLRLLGDSVPQRGPNKVPVRSQQGPSEVPPDNGSSETIEAKGPSEVPATSQEGPSEVPTTSTGALVPENREQRTETREQTDTAPDPDPDDAALPAWSAKAHRPRGVTRPGLVRAVAEVLEVIQGRPGASATAAKPVLSLWKALEYPPLRGFVPDLRLIAEAAHDCPDRLFARDIRAEGWADGVNRESDPTTICRHDRWDARLQAARAWEAAGKPTARGSPATARASPSGGSWMDDLRALREPDKPPRKRIDPDHLEEPPWPT